MATDSGMALINEIYRSMGIDPEWSVKRERGFTWWAKDYAQTIWAEPAVDDLGCKIARVHATTDILTNFSPDPTAVKKLAALMTFATLSGFTHNKSDRNELRLSASVYVHEQNYEWMSKAFMWSVVLQAHNAQAQATVLSEIFGLPVAKSSHPKSGHREVADEMLQIVEKIICPAGQNASAWSGADHFEKAANMLNTNRIALLATAGTNGLTAEFPFGEQSSLLTVQADQPNSALGNGLLMIMQLPIIKGPEVLAEWAHRLNNIEQTAFTRAAFLGSWCVSPQNNLSYVSFIPNVAHHNSLMFNLCVNSSLRARWASEILINDDWITTSDGHPKPRAKTAIERIMGIFTTSKKADPKTPATRPVTLPEQLATKESPRALLEADFRACGDGIPINGGWGYTLEDACIIDKHDPCVDPDHPFDGVAIEYLFVEKRIYEEMIIHRPQGDKYADIKWKLEKQSLVSANGRSYDHLVFNITALHDTDFETLKAEYEGPRGHGHKDFDEERHLKKDKDCRIEIKRDYWFDITSFYGEPQDIDQDDEFDDEDVLHEEYGDDESDEDIDITDDDANTNEDNNVSELPMWTTIPQPITDGNDPLLKYFPKVILFIKSKKDKAGQLINGEAIYCPAEQTVGVNDHVLSMEYGNMYEAAIAWRVTITYDSESKSYIGTKYAIDPDGSKVIKLQAQGKEWKQFFTQLTMLGLMEDEPCRRSIVGKGQ